MAEMGLRWHAVLPTMQVVSKRLKNLGAVRERLQAGIFLFTQKKKTGSLNVLKSLWLLVTNAVVPEMKDWKPKISEHLN